MERLAEDVTDVVAYLRPRTTGPFNAVIVLLTAARGVLAAHPETGDFDGLLEVSERAAGMMRHVEINAEPGPVEERS